MSTQLLLFNILLEMIASAIKYDKEKNKWNVFIPNVSVYINMNIFVENSMRYYINKIYNIWFGFVVV